MPRVREMQGVPAHIETLKSNNGKRRSKNKCIYSSHIGNKKYKCICDKCPCYDSLCPSSSHCLHYTENLLRKVKW